MTDIILFVILAVIIIGAVLYVYNAKKSGRTCIGCSHAKACSSNKCGCGCTDENNE